MDTISLYNKFLRLFLSFFRFEKGGQFLKLPPFFQREGKHLKNPQDTQISSILGVMTQPVVVGC
jgi:hypothetical protein